MPGKRQWTKKRRKATKGGPTPSRRYTPPTPRAVKESPRWVPVLMVILFVLSAVVIILNYLPDAPLLPGPTSNKNLAIGFGIGLAGLMVATRYH